ncbi:MAG: AmmeMemoRadiSam system protein B, partial [Proteobacteria bacterium]|nr:AmmeMemoRadiSam system protein B [Pseudomonadota bacterium]
MPDDRPKLRPIDIVPLQTQGRQAYLLRDPERLSPHEVVVPADVVYLISQFDGTHTVREAQVSYVRRFGTLLTTDKIADVLRRLDEAVLLDTEHFREFRAKVEADFRARPTRAAAHAGSSYEEGAGAFVTAWEPRLAAASIPEDFALDDRRPALIVPHYDMKAAADSYAAAYGLLGRGERPQVVVILGIGHGAAEAPFVLTRKPFETPFGALETDRDLIDKL